MQPAGHGSRIRRCPGEEFPASGAETAALRLCDGSRSREEIEAICRAQDPGFGMNWEKFSVVLDWQDGRSDPGTTAPQLRSFDRQLALKREAPSPWPWSRNRMPYISSATFFLTEVCNHRCTYCLKDERGGKRLAGEVWTDALDQLLELGLQYLTIRGGEPVLHPAFWSIVKHAAESGVCVALQTNGTLWQEEDIDRLAAIGLDFVRFHLPSLNSATYDAVTRSSGDLSRALRNLGRFHDRGIYLRVDTVVTSENAGVKDLSALIRYCCDLGVEQVQLTPFVCSDPLWEPYIPSAKALGRVSELVCGVLEDRPNLVLPGFSRAASGKALPGAACPCGGAIESLAFLPDGGITFCPSLALLRDIPLFGNLQTDRIRELWYSGRVDGPNEFFEYHDVCQFCDRVPRG